VHGILFGLSDPVRVRIFAELVQREKKYGKLIQTIVRAYREEE
jgi:hypothetical protein